MIHSCAPDLPKRDVRRFQFDRSDSAQSSERMVGRRAVVLGDENARVEKNVLRRQCRQLFGHSNILGFNVAYCCADIGLLQRCPAANIPATEDPQLRLL
jgi:hypothetical protein